MFESIKKIFKKKAIKYATSKLMEQVAEPPPPVAVPQHISAKSCINYSGRLRQSLLSGDKDMQILCEKYLKSKGLWVPKTLSECDVLIDEIEHWE
jgi:hypothetical protein